MKRLTILLTILAVAVPARAGALRGSVVDAKTLQPLPGATVSVEGTLRGTSSGPDGQFLITRLAAGTYGVAVSMVGYQRRTLAGLVVDEDDTVTLQIRMDAVALQTDPIIVTASRREQSLQESPVSVSVMDATGLQSRTVVTFDEALRYIPGVNVTESQVSIRGSSGYNRGAGSRVLMLVDGIPMLTGDTGEINYDILPVNEIDRIEVVKGASSALYGSNALGGVLNLITRPIGEEPLTYLSTYGGLYNAPSHNEWKWADGARGLFGISASHERRIADFSFRAFLSMAGDDSYRRSDLRHRFNGSLKLRYDISAASALTVNAGLMDLQRDNFLYWQDLHNALLSPDDQVGDRVHSTRFFANGIYQHTVSSSAMHSVRALWFRNHFTDSISEPGNNSTSDVLRGEYQLTLAAGTTHLLTAGAEGNLDLVRSNLFGERSGGGIAAYLQDEIRLLEDLRLTLGARFDLQDVDSLEITSQLNPKAALVYMPIPGTSLRSSVGRGFRAPTVAEAFTETYAGGLLIVPNPALRPERSWSFEVGVNQLLSDVATFDVSGFLTTYSDLIESGFNAAGQAQFSNVTDASVAGFEVASSVELLERALFLDAAYTYVYPRDRTRDDLLKYRPRHLAYVSGHGHLWIFTLGAEFRYASRVERIDEEFVNLGIIKDGDARVPISVFDLRASADFTRYDVPLVATFNVKNLFQYNYVELIGNLAPPRVAVLRLDVRL